jgi:hypothetical protein
MDATGTSWAKRLLTYCLIQNSILCTIDIVDAAISPCVTLCHILTPILVIKVTIMTRVFDRPARRYAMEGMESIPDLNFLLLI